MRAAATAWRERGRWRGVGALPCVSRRCVLGLWRQDNDNDIGCVWQRATAGAGLRLRAAWRRAGRFVAIVFYYHIATNLPRDLYCRAPFSLRLYIYSCLVLPVPPRSPSLILQNRLVCRLACLTPCFTRVPYRIARWRGGLGIHLYCQLFCRQRATRGATTRRRFLRVSVFHRACRARSSVTTNRLWHALVDNGDELRRFDALAWRSRGVHAERTRGG